MIISRLIAKWDVYRLNKWIELREKGTDNTTALKAAWLSAGRAHRVLEGMLNTNIGNVGVLVMSSGGQFKSVSSFEQTHAAMVALAYLYSALPEVEQKKLLDRFQKLTDHGWGYVRRAADAALIILESEGHYKSEGAEMATPRGDEHGDTDHDKEG